MNNLFYTRVLRVSVTTGVPTKNILDLFWFLKSGEGIDNSELIGNVGIAKVSLNKIKQSFGDLLCAPSFETRLNEKGIEIVGEFDWESYTPISMMFNFASKVENDVADLRKYLNNRPKAMRQYDQFTAEIETVQKRANLMNFLGDIRGKRILLLGDDDFLSIAIAKLNLAKSITVLDIDKRIINSISDIAKEMKVSILTDNYDAIETLPKRYINSFDSVFTDPPYTTNGFELFLSRAVSSLDRGNLASRVYLCYGNSDRARERFLPIYKCILDSGLMFRYVFDKFNQYSGAESIGSTSSLFVIDSTPKMTSLVQSKYDKPIYTIN